MIEPKSVLVAALMRLGATEEHASEFRADLRTIATAFVKAPLATTKTILREAALEMLEGPK